MPPSPICQRSGVVRYDGPLRMLVPSRRANVLPWLVELDAFEGNGQCSCPDFTIHKEPFLRRGVTPQVAHEAGLVEIPSWGTVEDCLRCYHIHVARLKFADDVIAAIVEQNRTPNHNPPKQ